jgi:hypothetical protein
MLPSENAEDLLASTSGRDPDPSQPRRKKKARRQAVDPEAAATSVPPVEDPEQSPQASDVDDAGLEPSTRKDKVQRKLKRLKEAYDRRGAPVAYYI